MQWRTNYADRVTSRRPILPIGSAPGPPLHRWAAPCAPTKQRGESVSKTEVIVQSGFRGLRYSDGRFEQVLEPARYELPKRRLRRVPRVVIVPIDVRERELTIKGQEILTADKV